MIASLLSDREAQSVGDVFEEAGKAIRFLGERSVQDLSDDEVVFYAVEAVERAMMNVSEACIRIEKSAYAGRFEALFPDFAFDDLRRTGNFIRHAYDDRRVDEAAGRRLPLRDEEERQCDDRRGGEDGAFGHGASGVRGGIVAIVAGLRPG